jgi:O-antigen/teichoic acid export membrane protein
VIVGHVLDVEMLGVYSLAFTLAFAPVTQFAWQVGKVFLAAAAAIATPAEVGRRAVRATTATSLLLVPLVIPAIALAPLLPAVLGDRWAPMVTPLRILLAVGVVHAVLAVIREFLNGAGFVSLSARIELLWLVGMVAALVPAVSLDGIRGAALAHVATLVPLTAAYLWLGLRRRLDVGLGTLAAAFRPLAVLGAAQAGTTAAVLGLLEAAGAPELTAAVVASCAGLAWVPALAERVQPGLRERAARMLSSRLRARPPHPAPQ